MLDESHLERDVVQFAAREAAAVAMETPLREPLVEAVERSIDADREPPVAREAEPGRPAVGRTAIALAVAVGAIYLVARRFTGDRET